MLVYTVFIFLLFILTNGYITQNVEKKIVNNVSQEPLYDLLFEILPNLERFRLLNDIISICFIIAALKLTDSKKTLQIMLVIGIIRIAITYLTVFPKSTKSACNFYKFSLVGGCHDKILSGHTAMNVVASLQILSLYPQYKYILLPLNLLASFLIIASRDHYTIDVVIGYLVSILIFTQFYSKQNIFDMVL
jgi:hypothetical protein